MSERYIDVCNWERFQHRDVWRKSGGRPPWIKNYTALLHNDAYMGLTPAQRGILHGLWLMYASAGQSINENTSRRYLARNKGESRHFQEHLEVLKNAGFIHFVSQPISAPVAPRVEERREEESSTTFSELKSAAQHRVATEAEIVAARERREQSGWVDNLSSYTGCRYVRGEVGIQAVRDPLGTEPPPEGWPHSRPTKQEVVAALRLKEQSVA